MNDRHGHLSTILEFERFRLDPEARSLEVDGKPLSLSPTVFDLLVVLVRNAGRAMSRDELTDAVWPDVTVSEPNLTQTVWVLRRALGAAGKGLIVTLPRHGYRLVAEVRVSTRSARTPTDHQGSATVDSRPNIGEFALRQKERTLPLLPVGLVAAVLFLLVAAWWLASDRLRPWGRQPGDASRPSVAVLGFSNLSGHSADDWIGTALAETMTAELSVDGYVCVVPSEAVASMRRDLGRDAVEETAESTLERIRRTVGTGTALLRGSYLVQNGSDGGVRVSLKLRLPDAREIVIADGETWQLDELFDLADVLGIRVAQALGQSPDAGAGLVRATLPKGTEAVRVWAQALERRQALDLTEARKLLQRCIELDDDFAPARGLLAETLMDLGFEDDARIQADQALAMSASMPRVERLRLEALCLAARGDFDQAVRATSALWEILPDETQWGIRLIEILLQAERPTQARALIQDLRDRQLSDVQRAQLDLVEAQITIRDDLDTAEVLAARAARRAGAAGARLLKARSNYVLARIAARAGDSATAKERRRRAHEVFEELGDTAGVIACVNLDAVELQQEGELVRSAEAYRHVVRLADEMGWIEGQATALTSLGGLLKQTGDYEEASTALTDALRLRLDQKNNLQEAHTRLGLASLLLATGKLSAAVNEIHTALPVFERAERPTWRGNAQSIMAGALCRLGRLVEARASAREAVALFERTGHAAGLGYALLERAAVRLEMADVAGALGDLDRVESIAERGGYRPLAMRADLLAAEVLIMLDRPEEGMERGRRALATARSLGEPIRAARANLVVAAAQLATKQPGAARESVLEAFQGYQSLGLEAELAATLIVMARIESRLGNTAEARRLAKDVHSRLGVVEDLRIRLQTKTVAAIYAATAGPDQRAWTRNELVRVVESAGAAGLLPIRFEVELELAKIEFSTGDPSIARARLITLHERCSTLGLAAIARSARQLERQMASSQDGPGPGGRID